MHTDEQIVYDTKGKGSFTLIILWRYILKYSCNYCRLWKNEIGIYSIYQPFCTMPKNVGCASKTKLWTFFLLRT